MKVCKVNIYIEIDGEDEEIKKFRDELETFIAFKPQFNIYRDFIGLEPIHRTTLTKVR